MKTKLKSRKALPPVLLFTTLLFYANYGRTQLCGDNVNTVYGLTTAGELYPVNINTGTVGTLVENLTDGVNPASNSNAIGYNSVSGKFYYFYRCAAATAPNIEFVSYNPATNSLQVLAAPALATPAATKMRSGCVNPSGTGYYTFEVTAATTSLWYYTISTNTWTKITSSFKNGATDYTPNFVTYNSGDMGFDKNGSLWIIISNSADFAMYKIPNPPTTAVASINNVQQVIPITVTPGGVSFTGFSFNANGVLFLTSGSGAGVNNNMLYKMTTTTSGVSPVATLKLAGAAFGAGDDLTSCVFTYVLSAKWLDFSAKLINNKGAQLNWSVTDDANVKEYYVERSINAATWQRIATIKRKPSFDNRSQYAYTDVEYGGGNNYYRIGAVDVFGKTQTSDVEKIVVEGLSLSLSPNPAMDKLNIKQVGTQATRADIYDAFGKLILSTRIHSSSQTVDISQLTRGNYFLKLSDGAIQIAHTGFLKL